MTKETDVIMKRKPGQLGGEPERTLGPRALAVIESVLARFSVLVECEHLAEGEDAIWVALQPDSLLCDFCWEAAQVLAGDAACSGCGRPASDPRRDCVVVARPVSGLAVHFWLCVACSNADLAEADVLR